MPEKTNYATPFADFLNVVLKDIGPGPLKALVEHRVCLEPGTSEANLVVFDNGKDLVLGLLGIINGYILTRPDNDGKRVCACYEGDSEETLGALLSFDVWE